MLRSTNQRYCFSAIKSVYGTLEVSATSLLSEDVTIPFRTIKASMTDDVDTSVVFSVDHHY